MGINIMSCTQGLKSANPISDNRQASQSESVLHQLQCAYCSSKQHTGNMLIIIDLIKVKAKVRQTTDLSYTQRPYG